MPRCLRPMLLTLLIVAAGAGFSCSKNEQRQIEELLGLREKPEPREAVEAATLERLRERANSIAVKDTVGELCYVQGRRIMRVRGYGIVVGLGRNGSREVPSRIREGLVKEIRRRNHASGASYNTPKVDPDELLDSRDTAVVLVAGEIKPASTDGTHFDVSIQAVQGTQTESLAGGHLWRCDLKMYRETASGKVTDGRVLAYAEGPVYIPPFTQGDDAETRFDPRRGRVLGGGVVTEARTVHLELYNPSYQTASRIATRINDRFSGDFEAADAISPGRVRIKIPPAYHDDPDRFLDLSMHLYLDDKDSYLDDRAHALAEAIQKPNALREDIALAWEGIGRASLPVVRDLYTNSEQDVVFYAARTGLRLNDDLAIEVVRRFAYKDNRYQPFAIRELGLASGMYQAADAIRPLLANKDTRVRGWAYEALLKRGDKSIRSIPAGDGDFYIDVIDTAGAPMMQASTEGEARLALFGNNMRCATPVFYTTEDRSLVIDGKDDGAITVIRQWSKFKGALSFKCSPAVPELVRRLAAWPMPPEPDMLPGAGLGYSQVVETLYALCEGKYIDAQFVLERPRLSDLLRPLKATGRSMTDLD